MRDDIGWRFLLGVMMFLAVLAIVSLLSIEDYDPPHRWGTTEVKR